MSTRPTKLTAVPAAVLIALLGAACGGAEQTSHTQGDAAPTTARSEPMPPPAARVGGRDAVPNQEQEHPMNIRITIGEQTFGVTLKDSPAAQDLLAQLPVTVR